MKIALVNQPMDGALPPTQTSLSIWSYQVARRLAETCDVTVFGRRSGDRPDEETIDGVRFRHVGHRLDRRLIPWLQRWGGKRKLTRPLVTSRWYALGYGWEVARDLQRNGCDLALVFNYSQFPPMIRRFNPHTTIVLDMQCEWMSQFDRAMCAKRLRSVDVVVGCSGYIAAKVRERFPEFTGPCQALYNGVDVGHFTGGAAEKPADAPPRILFVGRISPEKGLHVLLDALAEVRKDYPNVVLDIVGSQAQCPREILVDLSDVPNVQALARFYDDKSYYEHLVAQVERLKLTDNVMFSGFVPHAEAAAHYAAADVLANPSLSEAFGMSLAEGMAAGLPCLATQVGGMPEVVEHGVTGLLTPPDDPAALADALRILFRDPAQRRTMGQAGRVRAQKVFAWDRIAEELLAIARRNASQRALVEAADVAH